MAEVAVTVLAKDPGEYEERLKKIQSFSRRIHIDIADGVFAPTKTIGLSQVYELEGRLMDFHLMLQYPASQLETVLSLNPHLVIAHFEAKSDLPEFFDQLKAVGIKCGLAILPDTTVAQIKHMLPDIDHLLVFTGRLGYNQGEFQGQNLDKISQAKQINPNLEVGVDGGINEQSARLAIDAGADVLDSGSFVHDAKDPKAAYQALVAVAQGEA